MDNFDLRKYLAEGRLFEEDFKNPILDKYLKLKKSIDYKTVFPTDLKSFVDSLDNTEREGLKSDLAKSKLYEEEGQWFDPSSSSHGKGYKMLGNTPQKGAFYVSGYDYEKDEDIEEYVLDPNYDKYMPATQELLDLADEQGHEYKSVEEYYEYVEGFQNDLRDYAKGGKFEGEEIPNWLMKDLATAFGTDYSQFYSDGEDDEDEDDED